MKTVFAGRYNKSEILNGPEKAAKRIFHEYSKIGECAFIEYFFDGNKYSIFKKLFGFEVAATKTNSEILRLGIFRFLIYLFKQKPVNIHIVTFERFILTAFFYKLFFNVNIIYNVHGIITFEDKLNNKAGFVLKAKNKLCEKIFMTKSDYLVFLSERSINKAKEYYKLDSNKIVIIPNGIDECFLNPVCQKIINYSDKLKIVFQGNLKRKEKGLTFLLQSLAESEINAELYVISDNIDFDTVGIDNLKIFPVKKMTTDELSKFYKDKDVFVCASFYEQFSIAAAEAVAAGLTALISEESGISEYITNGENGFLFKYGDKFKIKEILSVLNSDRQILKYIRDNSVSFSSRFTWDSVFNKYHDLYA